MLNIAKQTHGWFSTLESWATSGDPSDAGKSCHVAPVLVHAVHALLAYGPIGVFLINPLRPDQKDKK